MVDSDIRTTEGLPRQVLVQRDPNSLGSPMSLTVFVTTSEGYRQRQQSQCNITLSTLLGVDESEIDPAEGTISTMS